MIILSALSAHGRISRIDNMFNKKIKIYDLF